MLSKRVEEPDPHLVTVVVPTLNEGRHISRCLQSLIDQKYPQNLLEILVVDGGSKDHTTDIVLAFAKDYPNIKLLGGPGVNCPAAMNMGIMRANVESRIICKVDGHTYVDPDFVSTGVAYLSHFRDAKCAGGPCRFVPESNIGTSNSIARSSLFGVGGGVYASRHELQSVDSVQCGIYSRDVFREVGLFDESLQFGEDEELNWRIRQHGYQILLVPEIKFYYSPRSSFRSLYRQYFNYGRARVFVIKKHPRFLRPKHLVPSAFLVWLLLTAISSLRWTEAAFLLLATLLVYVLTGFVLAAKVPVKTKWHLLPALPASYLSLHLGYGLGFLSGLLGVVRVSAKPSRPLEAYRK